MEITLKRFIARDFNRTIHDDFILNVQPLLDKYTVAVQLENGWIIQPMFE